MTRSCIRQPSGVGWVDCGLAISVNLLSMRLDQPNKVSSEIIAVKKIIDLYIPCHELSRIEFCDIDHVDIEETLS